MKLSMRGQEKGDLLTEVTTSTGLTVCVCVCTNIVSKFKYKSNYRYTVTTKEYILSHIVTKLYLRLCQNTNISLLQDI
jgi:hypothetical protein